MAHANRAFTKQGPKRRRRTRRDTPEGGYSQYPRGWHPNMERNIKRDRIAMREALA